MDLTLGKKTLLLIYIVTFALMIQNIAHAYYLSGYSWDSSDIDPLYYYDTSGYSEVDAAADAWNAKDIEPWFDDGDSQSEVKFYSVYEVSDWDGAYVRHLSGNRITARELYLNTYIIEGQSYPSLAIKFVAGHEFGHCLGLDENEGPYIMGPTTYGAAGRYGYYGISVPQPDDEDGVQAIYG